MAKKQRIISDRLNQMYCFGTEPHELIRCLQECKQKLIRNGAKADNLPKGPEKILHFLRSLPPKAKPVISDWLRENLVYPESREPENVLANLLDAEKNAEEITFRKPLWREILGFYISSDCPEIIIQFLDDEEISFPQNNALNPDPLEINVTDEDIEQCTLISQGNDIPIPERIIPMFIGGLVEVFKETDATGSVCRMKLAGHSSPLAQKFSVLLSQFEASFTQKETDSVSVVKASPVVPTEIDGILDEIVFIGKVSALIASGAFFVTPISLLINGNIRDLSEEQAKDLCPNNGEAIGFLNHFSKSFFRGEIAIWKAKYQPSDKTAQYVISDVLTRVYPVIELPHASIEPDAVRKWLLTCYQPQNDMPVIFQLTDGLFLRLPGDLPDPKKYDFDMPLESYRKVPRTELRSHAITVVTELPLCGEKYDCAVASTWIKRLLKRTDSGTGFPTFSKVQIQNLTRFISEFESDNQEAYSRALSHLEQIVDSRAFLNETTQQLLALPAVEAQINVEKREILSRYENEQSQIKHSIGLLSEKKIQLEIEIADQKKRLKKETERINNAIRQREDVLDLRIRKTFETASQAGMETLAQTALLRAIIKNETVPGQQVQQTIKAEPVTASAISHLPLIATSDLTRTHQLLSAIEKQALAAGLSGTLLSSLVATANVTPVVGLIGKQAKKTIASLANLLAGGIWGEVSVHSDHFSFSDLMNSPVMIRCINDTYSMNLGDFLSHQQSAGLASVIELRGFNRTPPETLLPELTECLFNNPCSAAFCWTDRHQTLRHLSVRQPVLFVLTFTTGKSTFPLQAPFDHQLPVFLAESVWSDELSEQDTSVVPSRISPELWQVMYTNAYPPESAESVSWQPLKTALLPMLPDEKAQAVAQIAYSIGRRTTAEITATVTSLAPELMPYIRKVTTGESASVLEHLFQL